MRSTLISVLALTASLVACALHPKPKLPAQQTFNVCVVGGKGFEHTALVNLKGEDKHYVYGFDNDLNGQYKFWPDANKYDVMSEAPHAFMTISRFDSHKVYTFRGGDDGCQDIVGRVIY